MKSKYKWAYSYQFIVLFGIIGLTIMDYMHSKELNQMMAGAIISLGVGIPMQQIYSDKEKI